MYKLLITLLIFSSQVYCSDFQKGYYPEWQKKRIDCIIDFYGSSWFKGKKILEVGCGEGNIGYTFSQMGADVTISDGRPEYCIEAKKNYPKIKVICADLDEEWAFDNQYDMIIHMATLYHLANPEKALMDACCHCKHLVLETGYMDSFDDTLVIHRIEEGFDQSINNIGSFFSPSFVERILKKCNLSFWSLQDDRCNCGYWSYDIPQTGSGDCTMSQRRMWFCRACYINNKEN